MKKIDATVLRETRYIAVWVLLLSMLMQSVFLLAHRWDYTVLTGDLLSSCVAIANFLLMGITVQSAVTKEEKEARGAIRISQIYRLLLTFIALVVGVALPCFNTIAVILPIFFPRIAIAFRPLFDRKA